MEAHGLFASGLVTTLVIAFLVVLAILWFLLPFAVFGIKGKLDEVIGLQRKILNALQGETDTPKDTPEQFY